jgi:2-hydroxymuconate-semialdehyde hydrolase
MAKLASKKNSEVQIADIESHWLETAPGERTHYHDLGDGQPIVFLHGSGVGASAAANWSQNLPILAESHRVIAFDQLGFGQTQAQQGEKYGIDSWVSHVIRVLDALQLDRVILAGNSMGGWISLQTAIDHPQRVAGVLTMGTGHLEYEVTAVLRAHARPEFSVDGIRRILLDFVVDQSLVTEDLVQARFRAATMPGAAERYRVVIDARNASSVLNESELSKLSMPAMIIHGRRDQVVPLELAFRLFNLVPHSDLHILEDCGHWAQIERAGIFNQLVTDLAARVDSQRD